MSNFIFSPAANEIFILGNINEVRNQNLDTTKVIFPNKIIIEGDLILSSENSYGNPFLHMIREGFPSYSCALIDIEFKSNRLKKNGDLLRESDFRKTMASAMNDAIRLKNKLLDLDEREWLIWINIQNQIGDFEAEPNELLALNSNIVLQNKKNIWWFDFDITFALNRKCNDIYYSIIEKGEWGGSLSPVQILLRS